MKDVTMVIARTPGEREACAAIRRNVFVDEQGLFASTDTDEHDANALHILACVDGVPAGTVRCYRHHGDVWYGGRLAVLHSYRLHLGAALVRRAEEVMKARPDVRRFLAVVQEQNVLFFHRLGWMAHGVPFMFDGIPHQLMEYALHKTDPVSY